LRRRKPKAAKSPTSKGLTEQHGERYQLSNKCIPLQP